MFDRTLWIVALSALLTLCGVSLLFCPTAHAGSAAPSPTRSADHTPTEASRTALTLQVDDDGDELIEHWSDPKFGREERVQMLGILSVLVIAGGISYYRKRSGRRAFRHG